MTTGQYGTNRLLDLTADAKYTSSDPKIARVEGSLVLPVADGTATITARFANREATAAIVVKGMENPAYVSFKNETLPRSPRRAATWGPATVRLRARPVFASRSAGLIRRLMS